MRILFVTSNRLGDAVLSTAVLGRLLEQYPDARITVAAGSVPLSLFASVPGLARVIPMVKGRRAAHWRKLWRTTVTTWWDLVVDLRASAFSYVVPTRKRLVFRPSHDPVHRVIQLAGLFGLQDTPPAPRLWSSAVDQAEAKRLIPDDGPVLALGPTANWGGKQWPAERFAETLSRLTGPDGPLPGARIAIVAAPNERDAARPVLDAVEMDRRIDLVGTAGLPVIGAALSRCRLYIGNDSGLMHMAAAAGCPTLGLFGPSPEARYAPWGEHCAVVRGPRSYAEIVADPAFDYRSHETCLGDLEVDSVVSAAEELIARTASR